tara:strand:- start:239 stop:646 length:408 start_codon:yes stop_codon:yes gene_type:complete
MEEKYYYTPQNINEFVIGLEYEYKWSDRHGYEQKVVSTATDLIDIDDIMNGRIGGIGGAIRVKKLDSADIVECGWEGEGTNGGNLALFRTTSHPFRLAFDRELNVTVMYFMGDTIFRGFLRNKSELLDQMRRCGI